MIRSFLSLQRASIGFDDAPVLTLRAYLAGDVFDDNRARANFFARAVEAVAAIPGVTAAAATTSIPGDDGGAGVRIVTDERLAPGDELGAQIDLGDGRRVRRDWAAHRCRPHVHDRARPSIPTLASRSSTSGCRVSSGPMDQPSAAGSASAEDVT